MRTSSVVVALALSSSVALAQVPGNGFGDPFAAPSNGAASGTFDADSHEESNSSIPGDAYRLTYDASPQKLTQFRILAPQGLGVRVTDGGRELVRDTIPVAFDPAPGHFIRIEVFNAESLLLDHKFEAKAGRVAQLWVVAAPTRAAAPAYPPAPGNFGQAAAAPYGQAQAAPGNFGQAAAAPYGQAQAAPSYGQAQPAPGNFGQAAAPSYGQAQPAPGNFGQAASGPRPVPMGQARAEAPVPAATISRCLLPDVFLQIRGAVRAEAFDKSKLLTLRSAASGKLMCVEQVAELLQLFSFGNTKLDALKELRGHLTDRENQFRLLASFTFESEKRQAQAILDGR